MIHSTEISWFDTGEVMAHGEGFLSDPRRRRFSVDKAKGILSRSPRYSAPWPVPDWWSDYEFSSIDRPRDYDTSRPIPILVGVIDGEEVVLDGGNRVFDAGTLGRDEIEAFYLTEQETNKTEIS